MNLTALGKVNLRLSTLHSARGVVGQKKKRDQVFVQGRKETGMLVYVLFQLLSLGI